MINPETKSIIWDLDGTLIDSFGLYGEILSEVLPKHDLPIPTEQTLFENYHGKLEESIGNAVGGYLKEDQLEAIAKDFLAIQNHHYEKVDHHIYPDALGLAQRAHEAGLFQAVVSNRAHEGRLNASPRSIVERSVLSGLLDEVICGDDHEDGHHKPEPQVIEKLVESGRLVPDKTVVVGDQFVDAQFAKNIGAKAIIVARHDEQIAHMDKLGKDWENYVTIVKSLEQVNLKY